MSEKIGIQNFRVFKDYTEFELRPLTLLTGPNNSGKSSFTKLLLLLKNGLGYLDFKRGKHNLEDFKQVLNWEGKNDEIRIRLAAVIPFFGMVTISYIYKEGRVSKVEIEKDKITLLTYSNEIRGPIDWAPWAGDNSIYEYYSINIEHLLKIIMTGDYQIIYSYLNDEGFVYEWINPNEVPHSFKNFEGEIVNMDNINLLNYRDDHLIEGDNNVLSMYAIKNEISKIHGQNLLFSLFIKGEDKTAEFESILYELQNKSFHNLKLEDSIELDNFDVLNHFIWNIPQLFDEARLLFLAYVKGAFKKYGKENIHIEVSPLGKILFQEKWFNFESSKKDSGESIISQLGNFNPEFSELFSQVDFISANRGNQRRVLQNESEVEIDKIVADFAEKNNQHLEFIERSFNLMGIPGKLVPLRYENTISVLYIEHEEQRVSLADLGFGFSQLIPVFLKIIMSKNILIIEEPEANLHPDLQSKLADILHLAVKEFPKKTFIIETHSEYLIRKLQYLTAKKELISRSISHLLFQCR